MTKSFTALCLLGALPVSTAFSTQPTSSRQTSTTALYAESSRRQVLSSGLVAGLSLLTGASAAVAGNEVDFGTVQDLLGNGGYGGSSQSADLYEQRSTKRPTFLTDPTEEFKENEKKSAEFKRGQLKAKKEFQDALDKLQSDPNDGPMLAKDLDQLRYLVGKNTGLPEGISKDDVVKQVRRRKAKKFWPTEVEIAYQDLLYEIMKKQSPNTDRDTDFV